MILSFKFVLTCPGQTNIKINTADDFMLSVIT